MPVTALQGHRPGLESFLYHPGVVRSWGRGANSLHISFFKEKDTHVHTHRHTHVNIPIIIGGCHNYWLVFLCGSSLLPPMLVSHVSLAELWIPFGPQSHNHKMNTKESPSSQGHCHVYTAYDVQSTYSNAWYRESAS